MEPSIHSGTLQSLQEAMEEQFPLIVTKYIDACRKNFPELEQAIRDKNYPAIASMAHMLTSSSAQFGAERLAHLLEALETAAIGQEAHIKQMLPPIKQELERVIAYLLNASH